ncbi:hypothetical protein ACFO9E_03625 [Streptomyces maoxianensis]|uniref:Secreted protein n=1 Tax=Streptomyces maoxianensis TaxID=1459942 RepID=A0ABV9G2Q4_9ACTN
MHGWKKIAVAVGSGALVLAMIATWVVGDLNTAAQAASVVGCVVGIVTLLFTLLHTPGAVLRRATRTGKTTTGGTGKANTGVASRSGGVAEDTGDATSYGGAANTGVTDRF